MLHLLPTSHKKAVLGEYQKRLTIVICSFVILLCCIVAIFLLPSYMYANDRYVGLKNAKNEVDKSIASLKGDKTADIVNKINTTIASLQPIGATINSSDVFDKVISYAGGGIHLLHFTYTLQDDSSIKVIVDGQADTRESLISFTNNLKLDPYFQGATVPLSNFTKEKNLLFSFNLHVTGTGNATSTASTTKNNP